MGSLDDENEKNAAAERPATAAKTPLGLGSEPVWWSASGFRSICIPQVLEVGGMGAALGAHRVSTAVANFTKSHLNPTFTKSHLKATFTKSHLKATFTKSHF